jgi:hypothetical protein
VEPDWLQFDTLGFMALLMLIISVFRLSDHG